MARKPNNIESQNTLFDPDNPNPIEVNQDWVEVMQKAEDYADLESIPHVDIKERRENLLLALGKISSVSRLGGLGRVSTDPELREVRDERAQGYPEGVFSGQIVPRSRAKRKSEIAELDGILDAAFGDIDAARKSAWSDFTEGERARLIVHHPDKHPDQDEMRIHFRAKYGGKDGSGKRNELRKSLKGNSGKQKAA